MQATAPAFGLLIIGDEILSGKREDKHLPHLVKLLAERGLQLAWAEIVGDDPERITATLRRTMASGDVVFSCGGIGATPDDHTRQCAARAAGLPLAMHEEGMRNIDERITDLARQAGVTLDPESAEHQQRRQMALFPQGATLVPNSYNKIAGFTLGRHHFLPGFPVMAAPMMAWVLDTLYPDQHNRAPRAELSVLLYGVHESAIAPLMETLERDYPQVKAFSLPHVGDAGSRSHIELGVKGEPGAAARAFAAMCGALDAMRAEYAQADGGANPMTAA